MPRYPVLDKDIVDLVAPPQELKFDPNQAFSGFVRVQGKVYACGISPLNQFRIIVTTVERGDGIVNRFYSTESEDDLRQWVPTDNDLEWNDHTYGYRLGVPARPMEAGSCYPSHASPPPSQSPTR